MRIKRSTVLCYHIHSCQTYSDGNTVSIECYQIVGTCQSICVCTVLYTTKVRWRWTGTRTLSWNMLEFIQLVRESDAEAWIAYSNTNGAMNGYLQKHTQRMGKYIMQIYNALQSQTYSKHIQPACINKYRHLDVY